MFRPGDLVGIKSKCCGQEHNAYHFCSGEDITFENITWTRQARGVLRKGISKIRFVNTVCFYPSNPFLIHFNIEGLQTFE